MIKQCVVCGNLFKAVHGRQIYCSEQCRSVVIRQKYQEKQTDKNQIVKQCKMCGKVFTTSRDSQLYCNAFCKQEYAKRYHRENKPKAGRSTQHCKKHDCLYSPPERIFNGCDYCYLTGEKRDCDIEHCTRYVRATRKERDKLRSKILGRGF